MSRPVTRTHGLPEFILEEINELFPSPRHFQKLLGLQMIPYHTLLEALNGRWVTEDQVDEIIHRWIRWKKQHLRVGHDPHPFGFELLSDQDEKEQDRLFKKGMTEEGVAWREAQRTYQMPGRDVRLREDEEVLK